MRWRGLGGLSRRLQPCQRLLIGERCLFIFDLIGDTINFNIAAGGEGYVVFCPGLSIAFSDQLLKKLAGVVLAGGQFSVEIFNGTENGGVKAGQRFLLGLVGLEAETITSATAGTVQRADIGQNVAFSLDGVNDALVSITENILVSIGKGIIIIYHLAEQDCVSHLKHFLLLSLRGTPI